MKKKWKKGERECGMMLNMRMREEGRRGFGAKIHSAIGSHFSLMTCGVVTAKCRTDAGGAAHGHDGSELPLERCDEDPGGTS
jgi:hypothetical protein